MDIKKLFVASLVIAAGVVGGIQAPQANAASNCADLDDYHNLNTDWVDTTNKPGTVKLSSKGQRYDTMV